MQLLPDFRSLLSGTGGGAGISINGQLICPGGLARSLDADSFVYALGNSIRVHNYTLGTDVEIDHSGANSLCAGGGIWAKNLETMLTTSSGASDPDMQVLDVAPDGLIYATGYFDRRYIGVFRPDLTPIVVWQVGPAGETVFSLRALTGMRAVWTTYDRKLFSSLSATSGFLARPNVDIFFAKLLANGHILEQEGSRLILRPWNSDRGWVLKRGETWSPDARISSGSVVVNWAARDGEEPSDFITPVVIDVSKATESLEPDPPALPTDVKPLGRYLWLMPFSRPQALIKLVDKSEYNPVDKAVRGLFTALGHDDIYEARKLCKDHNIPLYAYYDGLATEFPDVYIKILLGFTDIVVIPTLECYPRKSGQTFMPTAELLARVEGMVIQLGTRFKRVALALPFYTQLNNWPLDIVHDTAQGGIDIARRHVEVMSLLPFAWTRGANVDGITHYPFLRQLYDNLNNAISGHETWPINQPHVELPIMKTVNMTTMDHRFVVDEVGAPRREVNSRGTGDSAWARRDLILLNNKFDVGEKVVVRTWDKDYFWHVDNTGLVSLANDASVFTIAKGEFDQSWQLALNDRVVTAIFAEPNVPLKLMPIGPPWLGSHQCFYLLDIVTGKRITLPF